MAAYQVVGCHPYFIFSFKHQSFFILEEEFWGLLALIPLTSYAFSCENLLNWTKISGSDTRFEITICKILFYLLFFSDNMSGTNLSIYYMFKTCLFIIIEFDQIVMNMLATCIVW